MNTRIKKIRENLKLTREQFGNRLGLSGDVINNLERGRVEIKEDRINLICKTFNVNEDWLRFGKEPMFKPTEDEVASLVSELIEEDNPLYEIIKNIIKTYRGLDSKSQEVIFEFSKELLRNIKEEG